MNLHKLSLENSQNYILGGKADFVVKDINNSNHINFKVKLKENNIYYVSFKSIDWLYIGHIETKKIEEYNVPIFKPKKDLLSQKDKDSIIEKQIIFSNLIKYIYYLQQIPSNIEILYSGICSICGRKLTDPIYIEIGIGKICLGK